MGEGARMVHLIHTCKLKHIDFGDDVHPRACHIQDKAFTVVGYRRERGIDPRYGNRSGGGIPRPEGIDAGEGK